MTEDPEELVGGVANAGAVFRVGDEIVRPATRYTPSAHRFLSALRSRGCTAVPAPVGLDVEARERLQFIPGDVAVPPYPAWAQADAALASIAELMRTIHDAARTVPVDGPWSPDMADPQGGLIVCHNDVCLENVVFDSGRAIAIIDWDFAAPGRPTYDLAQMARMCVPIDDDESAAGHGWHDADRPARLRLVCDAYGLTPVERLAVISELDEAIRIGGEFVLQRVERGEPGFIQMWERIGGMRRYDRRREWWRRSRERFLSVIT